MSKAPASLDAVLVMCDFSDSLMLGRWGRVPGDFPPPRQQEILYAAHDSVFFAHQMRDVAEYFRTVSGGAFTLQATIHPRVVNLPHPMAWYGDHPQFGDQPVRLAADVLDSLAGEIDLSSYDTVILVHAGAGEETDILNNSPEQIYSTYLGRQDLADAVADSTLPPDGLPGGIESVLVLPECEYQDGGMYGSLGVYCYEVGLRLGMIPLVDFTPAGHPDSQGIGTTGLMGYGLFVASGWNPPHPCAYNKTLMGWQQPSVVRPGEHFVLRPAEGTGDPAAAARVDIGPQEYWLLEYRLQDPDGSRFWNFGDDLNGDGRRDFWDASHADGIPQAGDKFDPAADTREWLVGAEWDHYMTENGAAVPGLGGGGSGVYVWHINEAAIAESFAAADNGFNADPARKSVDLEEADGIQDLDSSSPSIWYLGGDFDAFRGGGADVFGPATNPRTDTAAGAATGLRFVDFGKVVLDSFVTPLFLDPDTGDTIWTRSYADTVGFTLERVAVDGPARAAERTLPAGVDLRGSHVLVADLDAAGSPADRREIVLADGDGGVWVLDGDLREYVDHDGNPDTVEPFAVGQRYGQPVKWLLPPAVGDVDRDNRPEIVLTTADGLFAFHRDGTPVRNPAPEAGANGLYRGLGTCLLPPVLVPATPVGPDSVGLPQLPVSAAVLLREGGRTHLRLFSGPNADPAADRDLGDVVPAAPPVLALGRLWLAVSDTNAGTHALLACSPAEVLLPEVPPVLSYPLDLAPGPFPVTWGVEPDGAAKAWVAVGGAGGGGRTYYLDDALETVGPVLSWPDDVATVAPGAPGGAVTAGGVFGRLSASGHWLAGWPRRPLPDLTPASPATAPGALVARLAGATGTFEEYLFSAADGRVCAYDADGGLVPDWPAAGPGAAAGTPALGQVTGGQDLDLVTVGSFDRITGMDTEGVEPVKDVVSTVVVFADVATGAVWPMAGGSPWRGGTWAAAELISPPFAAPGSGIVVGSHLCYPSPLTSGPLHVRASARAAGRARAFVYDLEGELVVASDWRDIPAREPFDLVIDLGSAASGMYLCRLVVQDERGSSDVSVVSFAVIR